MEGLIFDEADHQKIIDEFNRAGAFLTAVGHIENEILEQVKDVDFIAHGFFEKQVMSEPEMNRVTSQQLSHKAMVLLDVLKTKESRDVEMLVDLLRKTKQFNLARRIDEVLHEVNRIVNWKAGAVAPTQYQLPVYSRAETANVESARNPKPDIIGTQDGMLKLFRRKTWGAEPKREDSPVLKKGLRYVIISHTAQIGVYDKTEECLNAVLEAQQFNFSIGFADIAYNYLVGNDGAIYEGRGHSHEGATAKGWNHRAVGIAFIGKYVKKMPSEAALHALKAFLLYLKKEGILAYDFTIHCLRQVRENFPEAPGNPLYSEIKTWRANDPEGWAWREKDDEEEENKSDGEPLSEESMKKLKQEQPFLVENTSNTLKLLDILGEKGVLNRYVRKDMKQGSKSDEELRKVILDHIFTKGTYQGVEKLIEALVDIYQIKVANMMYKLFPAEERKKFNIQQRRKKEMKAYREMSSGDIQVCKLHGTGREGKSEMLGNGRYGNVKLAMMKGHGNEPVAVKELKELNRSMMDRFKKEARVQFILRNNHIVNVYGIVCEPEHCWIAMEYMANKSLNDLLHKVKIPWAVKVRMMTDVSRGLEFLHTKQEGWRDYTVTHCDIKTANILIDESYTAKISDFGSAVINYVTSSAGVDHQFDKGGTLTHMAPELVRAEEYKPDEKSDMWSFGITLFEVLAENTRDTDNPRVPFHKNVPEIKITVDMGKGEWHPLTSNNSVQMEKIPTKQCPKVLIDVMFQCCKNDPNERPLHFRDITTTLDEAYQNQYKRRYSEDLASLIFQHERLQRDGADQDQREQEYSGFQIESVAPVFWASLTI